MSSSNWYDKLKNGIDDKPFIIPGRCLKSLKKNNSQKELHNTRFLLKKYPQNFFETINGNTPLFTERSKSIQNPLRNKLILKKS
tara:strand:- start:291 stop:542 length:252 start_codon:yes stop_codon:yes gene_type:complete